jgi:hypothetical protein
MSFNEAVAKSLLRNMLDLASGSLGEFVPIADVVIASGRPAGDTNDTLRELAERRWVYIRGESVAASKWGLEFGMDWTNVRTLLRAIVKSAGGIGKSAALDVVAASSGLSLREVSKLLSELGALGLAAHCAQEVAGEERHEIGAYVSHSGWEYLTRQDLDAN